MLTKHSDFADAEERCDHLRKTVNMLPQKHRDCLEFLMFHLARVASRERENLVCAISFSAICCCTATDKRNRCHRKIWQWCSLQALCETIV